MSLIKRADHVIPRQASANSKMPNFPFLLFLPSTPQQHHDPSPSYPKVNPSYRHSFAMLLSLFMGEPFIRCLTPLSTTRRQVVGSPAVFRTRLGKIGNTTNTSSSPYLLWASLLEGIALHNYKYNSYSGRFGCAGSARTWRRGCIPRFALSVLS